MTATANPFVYGEIVTASTFADRQTERERLRGDLAAGQKVFLISPRRYGKSSLIRDVMRGLARDGVLTVEVTVAASSSYVGFLEAYARALLAADLSAEARWSLRAKVETPAGRVQRWVADLLKTLRPEVRFEPAGDLPGTPGDFTISFPAVRTARDTARLAAEVFALPGRIAAARRQRMAVALDEFQAVAEFDGGSVEAALRAAVQDQRMVGYVFAGSEPSLMERMLGPRRPFYKAGPVVRLEKIDATEFADFIERRFVAGGLKPEPGLGSAIVELAGNVPFDVQRLAHETWDDVRQSGRRTVGLETLHGTLTRLLGEQQTVFEESWQRLTLPQRAVLRALVFEDGQELMSADVRTRHRLPTASTVQSALAALVRQDVVMRETGPFSPKGFGRPRRYVVSDSLYREWVARRTS